MGGSASTACIVIAIAGSIGCGARTGLVVDEVVETADAARPDTARDTTIEETLRDTALDTIVLDVPLPDVVVDVPDTVADVIDVADVDVPSTAPADVSVGFRDTCIRTAGGRVRCWGWNDQGAVGDGTTIKRLAPAPAIVGLEGVTQFSVGSQRVCALINDGSVRCWGATFGSGGPILTPTVVPGLSTATQIAVGGDVCARTSDAKVSCWGYCETDDPCVIAKPTVVAGLDSVTQITNSYYATRCALRTNGEVWCWGSNRYGELGDGTRKDRATPAAVPGLSEVRAIAGGGGGWGLPGGGGGFCALRGDGSVWCWGTRLVKGTPDTVTKPERVDGFGAPVKALASSGPLSCALETTGAVECWGYTASGATGVEGWLPAPFPRGAATPLPPVKALAVGGDRVCAIDTSTNAHCWGAAFLGDGASLAHDSPTLVAW